MPSHPRAFSGRCNVQKAGQLLPRCKPSEAAAANAFVATSDGSGRSCGNSRRLEASLLSEQLLAIDGEEALSVLLRFSAERPHLWSRAVQATSPGTVGPDSCAGAGLARGRQRDDDVAASPLSNAPLRSLVMTPPPSSTSATSAISPELLFKASAPVPRPFARRRGDKPVAPIAVSSSDDDEENPRAARCGIPTATQKRKVDLMTKTLAANEKSSTASKASDYATNDWGVEGDDWHWFEEGEEEEHIERDEEVQEEEEEDKKGKHQDDISVHALVGEKSTCAATASLGTPDAMSPQASSEHLLRDVDALLAAVDRRRSNCLREAAVEKDAHADDGCQNDADDGVWDEGAWAEEGGEEEELEKDECVDPGDELDSSKEEDELEKALRLAVEKVEQSAVAAGMSVAKRPRRR